MEESRKIRNRTKKSAPRMGVFEPMFKKYIFPTFQKEIFVCGSDNLKSSSFIRVEAMKSQVLPTV